jgi:hypothetical protein
MRQTFASHYVVRGALGNLQAILGHASMRIAQDYARLTRSPQRATSILEGLGNANINAPSPNEAVRSQTVAARVI